MTSRNTLLSLFLVAAFALTACGGAPTPEAMMDKPTEDAMMEKPTEDAMGMHETPTPDAMMEKPTESAMMDSPAWFSASLTDARTGTAFTINDFKGKVVLVETMAVWCTKCYQQQEQIRALHDLLGGNADFVSVTLDIDPNEDISAVQAHVGRGGFDWLYAVAPAEVSRELAALYGPQFLNAPSVPMLVIDRHGVAHPLPFGIKSAEDLMNFLQPFFNESM